MKTRTIFSGISAIVIASLVLFAAAPWVSAKSGPGKNGSENRSSSSRNDSQREDKGGDGKHTLVQGINFSKEVKVNLVLTSVSPSTVTGTAKIKAERKKNSITETKVEVEVRRSSAMSSSTVYEAWLSDNETGYKLSLGAFVPNGSSNKAKLKFEENLVNLSVYDKLFVTEEPINDTNPNPGATVLSADIPATLTNMVELKAVLSGSFEIPVTTSTATGQGKFFINTASNTLMFDIRIHNLNGVETAAHIHGPASSTQNAGVLFTLPTGTIKVGTWNYAESQESDILNGRTYVNVHSNKFPDGEIRGQIILK